MLALLLTVIFSCFFLRIWVLYIMFWHTIERIRRITETLQREPTLYFLKMIYLITDAQTNEHTYIYTDMGQGCELPQTILCAILFAAQLKQINIGCRTVDIRRRTKTIFMIKPNNHAFNVSTVSAEAEARLRTRGRARADLL